MMTLDEFARRAIEVPFKEFGRSWDGWDCWGIPYLAFREILGIKLPAYSGQYKSTIERRELETLIDKKKTAWCRTNIPKAFDCALLKIGREACHVGLMLDRYQVLHVEQGINTSIERVDRLPWAGRVEGFYRHVSQPS